MLKVMKQSGIKKKKVRVRYVPARYEKRKEEFNDRTLHVADKIQEVL